MLEEGGRAPGGGAVRAPGEADAGWMVSVLTAQCCLVSGPVWSGFLVVAVICDL